MPTDTPVPPNATPTLPPDEQTATAVAAQQTAQAAAEAATAEAVVGATATVEAMEATYPEVDVRDLAKAPGRYEGRKLKLVGEVFTIYEGSLGFLGMDGEGTRMQIWVSKPGGSEFDREAVVVEFQGTLEGVYEGTVVIVYGEGAGTFSGTNAMGGEITQPLVKAQWVRW